MASKQPYDFAKFREELIRRFFNSQSYFFSCFSQQLKNLSSLAKDIDEDDYFLIAHVLEFLKNSDNPFKEINKMGEIERIHDFTIFLDETLTKLRQPNLPTAEMQEAIKLLAIDLVDALIEVIHDMTTKKQLLQIITGDVEMDVAVENEMRVSKNVEDKKSATAEVKQSSGADLSFTNEDEIAPASPEHGEIDAFTQEKEMLLDEINFDEMGSNRVDDEENDETTDKLELSSFELDDEAFTLPDTSEDENTDEKIADEFVPDLPVTFSEGLVEYEQNPSEEHDQAITENQSELIAEDDYNNEDLNPEQPDGSTVLEVPASVQDKIAVESEDTAHVEKKMPALQTPEKSFLNEPGVLKNEFMREANNKIEKLRNLVSKLEPDKNVQSVLKKLQNTFLDLRESAMIHGFEDMEELAQKSQKLMQKLKVPYRHLSYENIESISDIVQILQANIVDEPDFDQKKKNENLIQRLSNFERFIHSHKADVNEPEKIDDTGQNIPDTLSETEARPNINRNETAPVYAQPASELDVNTAFQDVDEIAPEPDDEEQLQLPGENDDELFKLIKEISEHSVVNQKQGDSKAEAAEADKKKEPEKLTIRDEYLETPGEIDAGLISFHSEGELYYRVAFESIETLKKAPTDRIALENLELSGYSLKGLAKKMDMDVFAHFPQLVEELLSKVLLLKLPCTDKPLNILQKGFQIYRKTKSKKDLENPEFQKIKREVLRFIQSLEDFTQSSIN